MITEQTKKTRCVFPIFRKGELYRFVVRISMDGYRQYVGCFKTQEDAIRARDRAIEKNNSRRIH